MTPDDLPTIDRANMYLAVAGILLSGATIAILLWLRKSFGAYTERIERSNCLTRQSNELTRHEVDRAQDELTRALAAVHRVKQDLLNERSA